MQTHAQLNRSSMRAGVHGGVAPCWSLMRLCLTKAASGPVGGGLTAFSVQTVNLSSVGSEMIDPALRLVIQNQEKPSEYEYVAIGIRMFINRWPAANISEL